MTTLHKAAQAALEALEHCREVIVERGLNGSEEFAEKWGLTLSLESSAKAINDLRAELDVPKESATLWNNKKDQMHRVALFRCEEGHGIYKVGDYISIIDMVNAGTPTKFKQVSDWVEIEVTK